MELYFLFDVSVWLALGWRIFAQCMCYCHLNGLPTHNCACEVRFLRILQMSLRTGNGEDTNVNTFLRWIMCACRKWGVTINNCSSYLLIVLSKLCFKWNMIWSVETCVFDTMCSIDLQLTQWNFWKVRSNGTPTRNSLMCHFTVINVNKTSHLLGHPFDEFQKYNLAQSLRWRWREGEETARRTRLTWYCRSEWTANMFVAAQQSLMHLVAFRTLHN